MSRSTDLRPARDDEPLRRLFGVAVATRFPFRARLGEAAPPAALCFRLQKPAPDADTELCGRPLYASAWKSDSGESHLTLLAAPGGGFVLRFPGIVDYSVEDDEIVARPASGADPRGVELGFLGVAMSFWLELRGVPTLHASAIEAGGGAVAFLAANRGGKTSIAATLALAGHRLLTDDVLALDLERGQLRARPSYPAMRMWPDAARHFGVKAAERVHPAVEKLWVPVGPEGLGSFRSRSLPLRALYIPERTEPTASIRFEALSRTDAVIELVQRSFSPPLAEAAGLERARLERLADLVRAIPVRRLRYPSGLDRLPEVARAVIADLAS